MKFEDKLFHHFFTTVTLVEGVYTLEFKQQYGYERDLQNTKVLHTLKYSEGTPLKKIHEDYLQIKGYHGGGEWVFKMSPENKYRHHTSHFVRGFSGFKKIFDLCVQRV